MTDQNCIRGCMRTGEHYAACEGYAGGGDCTGCAPVPARDGAVICHGCYGSLRRRIELAPELVEQLRTLAFNVGRATRFDRERVGSRPLTLAPVDTDLTDATRDVMSTVYAKRLPADADPATAREITLAGVRSVMTEYAELTSDAEAVEDWWSAVMSPKLETAPDYWTITRALSRWPLTDRRRWSREPCPVCQYRTVTVAPPAFPGAPYWFACTHCHWTRNDTEPDSTLTAAAYDPKGMPVHVPLTP